MILKQGKTKIINTYEDEHKKLFELFNNYRELRKKNPGKAKDIFEEFVLCLQRHMLWEEKMLFPIVKKQSDISQEHVMEIIKDEHRQIFKYLKDLEKKVQQDDLNIEVAEEKLLLALTRHEQFEDEVFCPIINKGFGDLFESEERSNILNNINTEELHSYFKD